MSLTLAAGYVVSLVGIYSGFVHVYRRQAALASKEEAPEPWFNENLQRDAYFTLSDGMPEELTVDHIKKLKAGLLRRAISNVERIWSLREDRSTLSMLLKNGAIGDELWNEFVDAETELNGEILDCVQEAESLEKGWGQKLFQQASEMAALERQKAMEADKKKTEAIANALRQQQEAERRVQIEKELIGEEEGGSGSKIGNKTGSIKSKKKPSTINKK